MAKVKVHIVILQKGYQGPTRLLETTYDMDFLPNVGEVIHPCKNDSNSGLTFEVADRYWDENGNVILNVPKHVIDPPGDGRDVPRTWRAWWTDPDGDLIEILLNNDWWPYGYKAGEEIK